MIIMIMIMTMIMMMVVMMVTAMVRMMLTLVICIGYDCMMMAMILVLALVEVCGHLMPPSSKLRGGPEQLRRRNLPVLSSTNSHKLFLLC